MFKKIRSFYRENRVYSILMIVSVICIVAIVTGVILYFLGQTNKDKYGNRLEGIENIKFETNEISAVKEGFLSNETVKDVVINVKGKLIYVNIELNDGTHKDTESLIQNSLDLFSEEVKSFYDIQFIVTNNNKEVEESFPIMGYIKAGNSVVKWTNYVD